MGTDNVEGRKWLVSRWNAPLIKSFIIGDNRKKKNSIKKMFRETNSEDCIFHISKMSCLLKIE